MNESGAILPPLYATEKLYEETRIMDGRMLANVALTRCLNVIGEPTTVFFKKQILSNGLEFIKENSILFLMI